MKTLALTLAAALAGAPLAYADTGAELFGRKCASCHGKDGAADTKMAAKLSIRAFSTPEVKAKLAADEVKAAVTDGIAEKKMPAFKEKLTDEELTAIVGYVSATWGPDATDAGLP